MANQNETANAKDAMAVIDDVLKTVAASMGTVLVQPSDEAEAAPKATAVNESGFYIYIGPNIKGLIQTGSIYRGDRKNAYEKAKAAIEKQPLVKTLIVSGDALPEARLKVKTPGNALYASYKKLAGK